mgnify:CR=1 FL=1
MHLLYGDGDTLSAHVASHALAYGIVQVLYEDTLSDDLTLSTWVTRGLSLIDGVGVCVEGRHYMKASSTMRIAAIASST